jgi:autotransporter-associated beta strand protein
MNVSVFTKLRNAGFCYMRRTSLCITTFAALTAFTSAAHAQTTLYWTSGIAASGSFTWTAPDTSNFASTSTGTPGSATYSNGNIAQWGTDGAPSFNAMTIAIQPGGVTPSAINVYGVRATPRVTFDLTENNALGSGNIQTNFTGMITFQNSAGSQLQLANNFVNANNAEFRFTGGDFRLTGTVASAGGNFGAFIRPGGGSRVTIDNGFAGVGQLFSLTSLTGGGTVRINGSSVASLGRTYGDNLPITIEVGADNALGPSNASPTTLQADLRTNATLKAVGTARTISNNIRPRGFNVDTLEDLTINGVLTTTSGERGDQVVKSGVGTLSLGGSNTSWWNTVRIQEGAVRITNTDGLGNASVRLSGGVLELAAGDLTLPVGTAVASAQLVQWYNQGGGFGPSGGFSAFGANRFVNLGGSSATMTWGSTSGFVTAGNRLIFGSKSSDAQLDFQNPIDLNGAVRTIEVLDNTSSTADVTLLSGILSGAAGGVEKTGAGTLRFTGANSYTGATNITTGALLIDGSQSSAVGLTTVSSGAAIGGDGTLGGSLSLLAGAKFLFQAGKTLDVNGATVSFGGFSIADVLGLDSSTPEGTYTLIDGSADFGSLANVVNVGPENAASLGDGKSAYFQQGSLQLVVVPEPGTLALASCGIALAGWSVARRRRASRAA